jgi:anti-sigma B factor antagonist
MFAADEVESAWVERKFNAAYDSAEKQPKTTMAFQVAARELDRIIVVDVVGRLTLSDSRTQLRDLVHIHTSNGRKKFLINLAGVDFIDSDGLGELTRCYSVVRRAGGDMKLVHVHQRVQALLDLTRLNNLFEIHDDEQVALQAFR